MQWTAPIPNTSDKSLPDITVTATPQQVGNLPKGLNGLTFNAHPGNGSAIIRVSGVDVSATQGRPLGAGGSIPLTSSNANIHWVCTESGTAILCVSQG